MLNHLLKQGIRTANPLVVLSRYASTNEQHTVLVVLYEGLINDEYFIRLISNFFFFQEVKQERRIKIFSVVLKMHLVYVNGLKRINSKND